MAVHAAGSHLARAPEATSIGSSSPLETTWGLAISLTVMFPVAAKAMSGKAETSSTTEVANLAAVEEDPKSSDTPLTVVRPDSGGVIFDSTFTDPADKTISTSEALTPSKSAAIDAFSAAMKLSSKAAWLTSAS
mmetsp:Transcript_31071/g.86778  ORF Transcript_31071/g.86778 Transcript_31071/m.86778 type:complete len:134 (+) Transcript_31071:210-611(+)